MPYAPDLSGSALEDRYELHAVIGEGAFGRVYRATDRRLERAVAVKLIKPWWAEDPEWARSFEREARILARLSDPGIVQIFDVGQGDEGLYYVSELIDGESLAERLRRGPLDPPVAAEIAAQLCRALARAHAENVVHRDVKPANIMLTAEGHVKVADFGIARLAEGSSDGAGATIVGTPRYMSPEQARGHLPTPATDVYSAGIVLYEMLAGVPPFTERAAVELALRHLRDAPPPLPSTVPPALVAVARRALAKAPTDRFGNGAEMAQAIKVACPGASLRRPHAGPAPAAPGARGRSRRRPAAERAPSPRRRPPRARIPRRQAAAPARSRRRRPGGTALRPTPPVTPGGRSHAGPQSSRPPSHLGRAHRRFRADGCDARRRRDRGQRGPGPGAAADRPARPGDRRQGPVGSPYGFTLHRRYSSRPRGTAIAQSPARRPACGSGRDADRRAERRAASGDRAAAGRALRGRGRGSARRQAASRARVRHDRRPRGPGRRRSPASHPLRVRIAPPRHGPARRRRDPALAAAGDPDGWRPDHRRSRSRSAARTGGSSTRWPTRAPAPGSSSARARPRPSTRTGGGTRSFDLSDGGRHSQLFAASAPASTRCASSRLGQHPLDRLDRGLVLAHRAAPQRLAPDKLGTDRSAQVLSATRRKQPDDRSRSRDRRRDRAPARARGPAGDPARHLARPTLWQRLNGDRPRARPAGLSRAPARPLRAPERDYGQRPGRRGADARGRRGAAGHL